MSAVRAPSSKLEGLNDRKVSKLQMLCGAKAKRESSVIRASFFFSWDWQTSFSLYLCVCLCVCVRGSEKGCLNIGGLVSEISLKLFKSLIRNETSLIGIIIVKGGVCYAIFFSRINLIFKME